MASAKALLLPLGIPHVRLRKLKMFSSTPGRAKGERCQASPLMRTLCRRNRSYRRRDYDIVRR